MKCGIPEKRFTFAHADATEGLPSRVWFLYFGRPPGGVVTVALSISEKTHTIGLGFAFTNMGNPKKGVKPDPHVKAEGRSHAIKWLRECPIQAHYLYYPQCLAHEIIRGILEHRFQEIARVARSEGPWPFVRVPSWTKGVRMPQILHYPSFLGETVLEDGKKSGGA